MTLTPQDWHRRFSQQACWTADLRDYIFEQIEIEKAQRILEVGCGTGAILSEIPASIRLQVGLDINQIYLKLAMRKSIGARLVQGDAHMLPCSEGCFDLTLCHFLLLWIDDPTQVVSEMTRVTRPGGTVIALAEPDYGGRIDFPQSLVQLGEWQTAALFKQGADPIIGRKLARIFRQAGLQFVQTGILGGQWSGPPDWDQWEAEWAVLETDLSEKPSFSEKLGFLKDFDKSAYERGDRVLFVPTFYAWGRVPVSS